MKSTPSNFSSFMNLVVMSRKDLTIRKLISKVIGGIYVNGVKMVSDLLVRIDRVITFFAK